ncbi:MAG: hypothetical protein V1793_21350 [Pseudomonadota bacterium]
MQKILVSLPDELAIRMKRVIPARQRSSLIAELLTGEVSKRENLLYQCACDVEADDQLNSEMADWDVTIGDGIESDPW